MVDMPVKVLRLIVSVLNCRVPACPFPSPSRSDLWRPCLARMAVSKGETMYVEPVRLVQSQSSATSN